MKKMGLQHLVVPEHKTAIIVHGGEGMAKGLRRQPEGAPPWQTQGNVSILKSSIFSGLKQIKYVKIPMSQGTKTKPNQIKKQQ